MAKMYHILSVLLLSFSALYAQVNTDEKLALEYLNRGEHDKAVLLLEKLRNREPGNETYYLQLKECYQVLKNKNEEEKLIKKQVKQFPHDAQYLVELGAFYKRNGEQKEAYKCFGEALKKMVALPDKVSRTAQAFIICQENEYALKAYREGEKYFGKYFYAFDIAQIYLDGGNQAAAVDQFIQMLNDNPALVSQVQTKLGNLLDRDPDGTLKNTLKTALLKEIQKNADGTVFPDMLIWLLVQDKNFEAAYIQAKALDKRLKEGGTRLYELSRICRESNRFETAVKCLNAVIEAGPGGPYYMIARMDLAKAMREQITSSYSVKKEDLLKLEQQYKTIIEEMGGMNETARFKTELANLEAFWLHKPEEAIQILNQVLAMPGISQQDRAQAKLELADVLILTGDMWEPALLYGQVDKEFKNDVQGQEAKYRSARLAYFRGDFELAQNQMKVLKASTSKLIANDALALSLLIMDNLGLDSIRAPLQYFSRAELHSYQNRPDLALATLDSISRFYPNHSLGDEVLYKKAAVYLKSGELSKAISALEQLLKAWPDDLLSDDALFLLGDLSEKELNDREKAMQCFEDILLKHKGSLYTAEARKRYRALRGDKVN
jgi:tetratricopeptide (TPR) repeat protein